MFLSIQQTQHYAGEPKYTPYVRAIVGAMLDETDTDTTALYRSLNIASTYRVGLTPDVLPNCKKWRIYSMTTEEKIVFLQEHASATPSKWREKAEWRQENKEWLRYSQFVAMKMLEKMEAEQISHAQLADRMGCSQEYVSKVLKGQENLSIETLCKIQTALGIQLLQPMFS